MFRDRRMWKLKKPHILPICILIFLFSFAQHVPLKGTWKANNSSNPGSLVDRVRVDNKPLYLDHDIQTYKYSSGSIGTREIYVVEADQIPVFTFERGDGNGFPQDPPFWTHHSWLQPRVGFKPAMLNQEIALILSYLHPSATMLEWGSGGSTIFFSKHVSKYYSIEHNSEWARIVSATISSLGQNNVQVNHVPADRKRSADGTKETEFRSYCSAPNNLNEKHFDFVLIDGRARQFCAKTILGLIDASSRVFVHDFPLRARYFSVFDDFFQVGNVVENGASEKGLIVLQKRRKE